MTFILDDLPPTPTPKDYLRLAFDPSQLPEKRIVGLLACQRDPLLRSLKTRITSASLAKIAAPPPQKGKHTKRRAATDSHGLGLTGDAGNGEGSEAKGKLWEIESEDAVIFPEGGGQPTDTGRMWLLDPNGGRTGKSYIVEGCLRRKLDAVHLVRVPSDGEPEFNLETIVGSEVEWEVDWDRRTDHMSIHTAQHLLSAVLDTYHIPTLSWSVTQFPSLDCPYVELSRGLTWAEAEEVEDRCNQLIQEDLAVWVETSIQQGPGANGGSADRESRGIPKDYEGGVIRHVCIDGIDRNACCGTQVPSLKHCIAIHIIPPATSSTSTKPSCTPTRLNFTAGPRALRYLRQTSRQLSLASQVIGVSRTDLASRIAQLDTLRKETTERERGVRVELAKVISDGLVREHSASSSSLPSADTADTHGSIVYVKRDEKATHDFEFIQSIASPYTTSRPQDVIVIISALPGPGQTALLLVQSQNLDKAKEVNEAIKNSIDSLVNDEDGKAPKRVKGGGAKGRFMSKIEGKWGKAETAKMEEVMATLRA